MKTIKEIFETLHSYELARILKNEYLNFGENPSQDFPAIANELILKRQAILEILLERNKVLDK